MMSLGEFVALIVGCGAVLVGIVALQTWLIHLVYTKDKKPPKYKDVSKDLVKLNKKLKKKRDRQLRK